MPRLVTLKTITNPGVVRETTPGKVAWSYDVSTNDLTLADAVMLVGRSAAAVVAAPPTSKSNGGCWLISATPSGTFASYANRVAVWDSAANDWIIFTPWPGQVLYVVDPGEARIWTGSTWAWADDGTHVGRTDNPHTVTCEQVGADAAGSAATVQTALDAHTEDTDNPHGVTYESAGADAAGSADAALEAAKLWGWNRAGISPVPVFPSFQFSPDATELTDIIDFSRNSAATVVGASGVSQVVAANVARFAYNASTGARLGLKIEGQVTNLYGYGEAPQVQSLTLSAVAYTCSCSAGSVQCGSYGTAAPGSPLTFTPTAGSVTFTPTSAANVQVETGTLATSYIPTSGGVQATRLADVCSVPVSAFPFRSDACSLYVEWVQGPVGLDGKPFGLYQDASNRVHVSIAPTGLLSAYARNSSGVVFSLATDVTVIQGNTYRAALSIENESIFCVNGGESLTSSNALEITPVQVDMGSLGGLTHFLGGSIVHACVFPFALSSAQLKIITS